MKIVEDSGKDNDWKETAKRHINDNTIDVTDAIISIYYNLNSSGAFEGVTAEDSAVYDVDDVQKFCKNHNIKIDLNC